MKNKTKYGLAFLVIALCMSINGALGSGYASMLSFVAAGVFYALSGMEFGRTEYYHEHGTL
jgi:hypothetical protein